MGSGITTGTGLVSGLPVQDIIQQLMSIEQRPKLQLQRRNELLQSQQAALQEVNGKLLAMKISAGRLSTTQIFRSNTATTSNESVLTAEASRSAVPGNYSFSVGRLVSGQQTISRGFSDDNATPVGEGVLSFQRGEARLSNTTVLQNLNGGEGVERGVIRITDRSGASANVDLSRAIDLGDVASAINGALGINVTASADGDQLKLTDTTGQTAADLTVADVGGTSTATSLGLAGSSSTDELVGDAINRIGHSSLLNALNDGNGIRSREGVTDFRITDSNGTQHSVDISGLTTLGDMIDEINDATGGAVTASVAGDGVSLKLTDQAGGGGQLTVEARNQSKAAEDLGIVGSAAGEITGHRLAASLNSRLIRHLNGGSGVDLGTIRLTNGAGTAAEIDLAGEHSVDGLIDRINDAGAGVTASLNDAGNGIKLRDTSGGSGGMLIEDVTGAAAEQLNLEGTHAGLTADSGNLSRQFITEATRLDKLGVAAGQFVITDSAGQSATVDLTQGDETTIGHVISEINSRGLDINARVNDTGDGILIEDTGPGGTTIRIEEAGGTTASDLGILGEAAEAGGPIDGSLTRTLEVGPEDTLRDVMQNIQDAGLDVTASIVNDGSGGSPYRMVLSSREPGSGGAFVFDDGGLGFNATNLSEARDAVMFFGSADPTRAIAITSRSNTVTSAIPGVTLNLHAASDQPVQVNIERDNDDVVENIGGLVETFNELVDVMDKHDKYDQEEDERGLLLGDPSIASVRRSIYNLVINRNADVPGQYKSLSQVGITVGEGAKLEIDEDKLRTALRTDRKAVEQLFSFRDNVENEEGENELVGAGIGVRIDQMLDRLTAPDTGPVVSRIDALSRQSEMNEQRIEAMDKSLESKRARLERQFLAMERAIADMQSQGDSLASLQQLATGIKQQGR